MATRWWWEREAERQAAKGDFKAAYETLRDQVGLDVVEVEDDWYERELEEKVIQLEREVEELRDVRQEEAE